MSNLTPFRHILVIEDRKARRIVALEEQTYSIGRESSNDIVIYDRSVSRHHATLLRIKEYPDSDRYAYRIIDGDLQGHKSTNGLTINGRVCESHNLRHGDFILFGSEAKVSYYILANAGEISLFNPLFPADRVEESHSPVNTPNDINKSTLINVQSLEQLDPDDLVRLASFPELSPNPIVEIDFDGNLTYLNPAASLKFETLRENRLDHPVLAGLLDEVQNVQGNLLLREIQVDRAIFEQYVHYLPSRRLIRSYLFEVTQRKEAEASLEYRAMHDLLTDLPNRSLFETQLGVALANAERNNALMAVMFLDLDNFKNINDTLGHSIGDRVLQSFGDRLQDCLRTGDTVARWGGDEFTILLPQIRTAEDTVKLAQRILNDLKQPFEIGEEHLYIKSSIGIAIYPQDGRDGETLLKNADAALYRAKERGRNHYRFYSATMTSKASLLLKLESLIHKALENEEFSLHYQPQLKLDDDRVSGMEALLRWYHAELGYISPANLIPLAEKTDLIIPISEWVLRTACHQNQLWQQAGLPNIPIAVNLSPRQFQQPNLVKLIEQTLSETGLEPHLLELEITETTIMQNVELARQVLNELREMGVQISMDDFGTGYSSLSYLQKFPFHTLKIDRAFVQTLQDNPKDTAIISAIISLGQSFHLRVVAEGVETSEQLELLKRLHCQEIQGYWFSRPLRSEDAIEFLKKHYLI